MLNVPQIEALRQTNPQLYEALKRVANAALGPNQGWNLDEQVTDGVQYARVSTGATTAGKIDPTKTGVLMKGSVAPTWSGGFTYVSTSSSITWSWSSLTIARADGTTTVVAAGGDRAGSWHGLQFLSLLGRDGGRDWLGGWNRAECRDASQWFFGED